MNFILVAKATSQGWKLYTTDKVLFSTTVFESLGDAQDYARSQGWDARRYV
jgi:hypothetical protein